MANDYTIGEGAGEPGLVSVVIPTYNRAHLIGEALESVLAQTHRPLEVLVIDDGSGDDTREVVERFGPEVRYLRQANAGVSAARNTGLRAARGEFIALLDSDDLWLPWKLEAQVAMLRRFPDLGMVWTDMNAVGEGGEILHERYLRTFYHAYRLVRMEEVCDRAGALGELWKGAPGEIAAAPFYMGDIFSPMVLGNLVHTSTVLLRRERLRQVGGFDTSLRRSGEDYEFHLRTTYYGNVGLLDLPGVLYRIGAADQLTAPLLQLDIARNNLTTVLRWLERGRERLRLSEGAITRRLAFSNAWVGEQELLNGDRHEARRFLWRSLKIRPRQPRAAFLCALTLLPSPLLRTARAGRQATRRLLRRRVRTRPATVTPAPHSAVARTPQVGPGGDGVYPVQRSLFPDRAARS